MADPLVFPIFPLDQVVLVPGFFLPLHVFEPRYRQMVDDALAGERLIAMAMPLPGHSTVLESRPPVHPIAVLGRIARHDALPDGRSNIVLQGIARVRVDEELETDRLYRLVRGSEFPDRVPDEEALERRMESLMETLPDLEPADRERLEGMDPARAVDAMILGLPVTATEKHRMLALSHVELRAAELQTVLRRLRKPGGLFEADPGDPRLN